MLEMAAQAVKNLWRESGAGEVSPQEAAESLSEILGNINALAK